MKALLIVNPVSGKRRITGELVEIISRLEKGGYIPPYTLPKDEVTPPKPQGYTAANMM